MGIHSGKNDKQPQKRDEVGHRSVILRSEIARNDGSEQKRNGAIEDARPGKNQRVLKKLLAKNSSYQGLCVCVYPAKSPL